MNVELSKLIDDTRMLSNDTSRVFDKLNGVQLNWKPNAESWSVGQCFEHLLIVNKSFVSELETFAGGNRKSSMFEKYSPFSGFFGGVIVKALQPGSTRKAKAPKSVVPSNSDIDASIIKTFVAHQESVLSVFKSIENIDAKRFVMTSPLMKFITYTLSDGLKIFVLHQRRHFVQAERVMQEKEFPK